MPARLFPLLLKPVAADDARGLRMVRYPNELSSVSWGDHFVLAQHYVDAGGVRPQVLRSGGDGLGDSLRVATSSDEPQPLPVPVTPVFQELVRGCREEFGLILFGLDVLESRNGPLIVDVTEFPNYSGVDEAPAVIGRLLLQTGTEVAPDNN